MHFLRGCPLLTIYPATTMFDTLFCKLNLWSLHVLHNCESLRALRNIVKITEIIVKHIFERGQSQSIAKSQVFRFRHRLLIESYGEIC